MKLIGIQKNTFKSKKTDKDVTMYSLAFEPYNQNDIIGVMATVYQCSPDVINTMCRLGYGGDIRGMIGEDFRFKLDQYRNIVALYLGDSYGK